MEIAKQINMIIKEMYTISSLDTIKNSTDLMETNFHTLKQIYNNFPNKTQDILIKMSLNKNTQKLKGVYYTPKDITKYIIANSFYFYITDQFNLCYEPKSENQIISILSKSILDKDRMLEIIKNITVFDPTCGSGIFLIEYFKFIAKLLLSLEIELSKDDLYSILKNINGNDIDPFGTFLSKLLLSLNFISTLKELEINYNEIDLANSFTNYDFIDPIDTSKKFTMILGNPPYIEKSKIKNNQRVKYGNIYGDMIHNSLQLLTSSGVLGFIIPLSYVSTKRMKILRQYVEKNTSKQIVLSYADRPDCLFTKVHQKCNIIFLQKNNTPTHKLFTSDYFHWYKKERENIFQSTKIIKNNNIFKDFYIKLGNHLEISILDKILAFKNNLFDLEEKDTPHKLYLNKRATFWIKCFITKPEKLSEYKIINTNYENMHYANIIYNSTIYWWFWIKISDCWHITNKEISNFKIPIPLAIHNNKIIQLSSALDAKLEKTKKYINTKQTQYEYKHKYCKDIIDEIDQFLGNYFNLDQREINYIKEYQKNYRMGIKNING